MVVYVNSAWVPSPAMPSHRIRLMSDESIANRIEKLVSEEQELRKQEEADQHADEALEEDRGRLKAVEVELDRCWDLLRRRRALREVGEDPRAANVRDAETVERYLQ